MTLRWSTEKNTELLILEVDYMEKQRKKVHLAEEKLFAAVRGKRIGLMMNSTAIHNDYRLLIDIMHEAGECEIAFVFGMEHGVRCNHSAGERDTVLCDEKTGIPIIDLYQYPGRRPPVESLRQVDAVVYCTQDAGVRHWTFTPWMLYLLDSAAEAGCPVIIVDRPNPIGGTAVEGNLVEDKYKDTLLTGFGYPIRHGMTVGELALMYKEERGLKLDLTVLLAEGWERDMYYSETGLLWVPPTVNITTPYSFLDFAATGLIQSSNLFIGDHTSVTFKYVGRPEFSSEALAAELNSRGLSDVYFAPKFYMSSTRWEKDVILPSEGVYLAYFDPKEYKPVRAQLHLIDALAKLYSEYIDFEYKPSWARKRMGTDDIYNLLERGESLLPLVEKWENDSEIFKEKRKPFLLYK